MSYAEIRGIPQTLLAADLRWYFRELIDAEAFACFHYIHRVEDKDSALESTSESTKTSKSTCACIVKFWDGRLRAQCIAMYNGRTWFGRDGKVVGGECEVVKFVMSRQDGQNQSGHVTSSMPPTGRNFLGELQPCQELMPNGNVGTPTRVFVYLVNCGQLGIVAIERLMSLLSTTKHPTYCASESYRSSRLYRGFRYSGNKPQFNSSASVSRTSRTPLSEAPAIIDHDVKTSASAQENVKPPVCHSSCSDSVNLSQRRTKELCDVDLKSAPPERSEPATCSGDNILQDDDGDDTRRADNSTASEEHLTNYDKAQQVKSFDWKSWTSWYLSRVYSSRHSS